MKKGHNKKKNKRKKAQTHQKLMGKHARKAKYDRAVAEYKLEVERKAEADKAERLQRFKKQVGASASEPDKKETNDS